MNELRLAHQEINILLLFVCGFAKYAAQAHRQGDSRRKMFLEIEEAHLSGQAENIWQNPCSLVSRVGQICW